MSQIDLMTPPDSRARSAIGVSRSGQDWRCRLADRWHAWRNRTVASPGFQRWAAAFPLTRRHATHEARALFDLTAGFVYSQILFACVDRDLFELLAPGSLRISDISARIDLSDQATARLLDAAVALRLLQKRDGDRYGLGMLGAALRGNPGAVAMIRHHAILYRDLADPVALLRSGGHDAELSRYWAYARAETPGALPHAAVGDYTGLMAASQSLVAGEILDAYPFGRHRHVLDVGGGDGSFLAFVAARHPDLHLSLFDLPAVAAQAATALAARGWSQRIACHGGSFRDDPLPVGADLITLVRVCYDHSDETVRQILTKVHAALPPGGTILVAEPMADVPGAEAVGDAYFGFYLLAMGSGSPRSAQRHQHLLQEAGFIAARAHPPRRPMLTNLVSARKPD